MKKNYWLIFHVVLVVTQAHAQTDATITTIILVRHAEKGPEGNDPELQPEGLDRAVKLAAVLKKTKVDAIYSTNYRRTKHTVTPLAQQNNLEVQVYDARQSDVIATVLNNHKGGTVVICGHSNTVPHMANTLTGKEEYKNFDDGDYGNLMIVSVVEKGKVAKVTWLTY